VSFRQNQSMRLLTFPPVHYPFLFFFFFGEVSVAYYVVAHRRLWCLRAPRRLRPPSREITSLGCIGSRSDLPFASQENFGRIPTQKTCSPQAGLRSPKMSKRSSHTTPLSSPTTPAKTSLLGQKKCTRNLHSAFDPVPWHFLWRKICSSFQGLLMLYTNCTMVKLFRLVSSKLSTLLPLDLFPADVFSSITARYPLFYFLPLLLFPTNSRLLFSITRHLGHTPPFSSLKICCGPVELPPFSFILRVVKVSLPPARIRCLSSKPAPFLFRPPSEPYFSSPTRSRRCLSLVAVSSCWCFSYFCWPWFSPRHCSLDFRRCGPRLDKLEDLRLFWVAGLFL